MSRVNTDFLPARKTVSCLKTLKLKTGKASITIIIIHILFPSVIPREGVPGRNMGCGSIILQVWPKALLLQIELDLNISVPKEVKRWKDSRTPELKHHDHKLWFPTCQSNITTFSEEIHCLSQTQPKEGALLVTSWSVIEDLVIILNSWGSI